MKPVIEIEMERPNRERIKIYFSAAAFDRSLGIILDDYGVPYKVKKEEWGEDD